MKKLGFLGQRLGGHGFTGSLRTIESHSSVSEKDGIPFLDKDEFVYQIESCLFLISSRR